MGFFPPTTLVYDQCDLFGRARRIRRNKNGIKPLCSPTRLPTTGCYYATDVRPFVVDGGPSSSSQELLPLFIL